MSEDATVWVAHDITNRKEAQQAIHRQLSELTSMHRLALAGIQAGSMDELIEIVTRTIGASFYPDHFGVILVNESEKVLRPHPSYRGLPANQVPRSIPLTLGVSGRVVASGQPQRIGDVRLDPDFLQVTTETLSELCVPIKIGERVIGVINTESRQLDFFTEADERLLVTIAGQVATSIEKLRLSDAEQRRVLELETLYQNGLVVSGLLDADSIGQRFIQILEEHLDWHHAVVRMIRPNSDEMQIVGYSLPHLREGDSPLEKARLQSTVSRLGEGLAGWAAQSGNIVRSGDLASDARYLETYPGIQSGLYVPMKVGERVIGVVSVESEQPNAFTSLDERLLSTLAAQTAVAIQNARLFVEADRRAQEFSALYDTSIYLSIEHDPEILLQSIVVRATALLNSHAGGMYLYHPVREELEMKFATEHSMPVGTRMGLGEGMAGRVAQTQQPMRIEDYSTWEGRSPKYEGIPVRATLEVPMLYRGELVGVLVVHEIGDSERQFSEGDERLLMLFASQAAADVQNARLMEETRRRLRRTQALREIDQAIAGSMNVQLVLQIVLNHTLTELGVDAAVILLYDPVSQVLKYEMGSGLRTDALRYTRLRLGDGFAGQAALKRATIHIPDLRSQTTDFLRSPTFAEEDFVCYFGLPLIAKGEIKGTLEIFHRAPLAPDREWLDFMETLAGQIAIAIDNATLYKDIQRSNIELVMAYDKTIEGWSSALDLRDKETEGPTQRVTELTEKLARRMGIHGADLLHVRRGSLLHDIGKMGIPDNILLKPDKLTDEEWEIMRRHPTYARDLLSPIDYLKPALDIPYCHHEKWDGTGYPRRLKGEEIPLVARIFAVVDVWDAVTSDRPYRPAWTRENAFEYIREESGKHFDPQVAQAFLNLMAAGEEG